MVVAETSGAVSPSSGWTAPTSFVASMLMAAIGCGEASAPYALPVAGTPVRLYVAAGQSNMVGYGSFAGSRHRVAHPLVTYQYRAAAGAGLGRPRAVPQFFRHGTIRQGLDCFRDRGVGPWWAFAHALVKERDDAEVRILMVAVNGSTLHDWTRDGGLLDELVFGVGVGAHEAMASKSIWPESRRGRSRSRVRRRLSILAVRRLDKAKMGSILMIDELPTTPKRGRTMNITVKPVP